MDVDGGRAMTISEERIEWRNHEGYADPTAYAAVNRIVDEQKRLDDVARADHRHWRLIKTLENVIDLMGYDLLGVISVRDRRTGKEYRDG